MCIDTAVGSTGLLVAQQVAVKAGLTSSPFVKCKAITLFLVSMFGSSFPGERDVPALVVGQGSSSGTVKVKWLVDGSCPDSDVPFKSVAKIQPSFQPGESVYRATLSFTEEEAKIISVGGYAGRHDYVTIQLVQNGRPGITYSSKAYRLRQVPAPTPPPAAAAAVPPPAPPPPPVLVVSEELLHPDAARSPSGFAQLFAAVAAAPVAEREKAIQTLVSSLRPYGDMVVDNIKVNHDAFDASELYTPFLAEVEAAAKDENKIVDILFHGTHKPNVPSILRESLKRSTRGRGDNWWFSRSVSTTRNYGDTPIVFAVIHDKHALGLDIITTQNKVHQLPLGHHHDDDDDDASWW